MRDPTISVIIPSLNSLIIDRVVLALQQQTMQYALQEIIIVGQDCSGQVPSLPGVHFIYTPQPLNIAMARNLGACYAASDYLLFLDADCIAVPKLLECFLMRHQQGYPVVGGSVMPSFTSYWELCDHIIIYAYFLANAPAGYRRYLPGGNLSIQQDLFRAIGGFDQGIGQAAGEDVDLSYRLRAQGVTLFFEPGATVYHYHSRPRMSLVWRHLHNFGLVHETIWHKHGFPAPLCWTKARHIWGHLLIAGAPMFAIGAAFRLYSTLPVLHRRWLLLPGLIWLKMAWYCGLAQALFVRYREV